MEFDYNTSRKQLVLPEYGRNIQKLVDYIKALDTKDERNRAAQAIITIMGNMNPHLRDINDFKHKLWDHLAIISGFDLDIDYPYELPTKEILLEKPNPVPYSNYEISFKHYGKIIELLIDKATNLEESKIKQALIEVIANHMKKSYITWNRESVNDEQILKDLYILSKGKIDIKELKLAEIKENTGQKHRRKRLSKKRN